ncbi:hypothetical protein VNO77_27097 [Canavalia gladiata]|uniref:Uncharacterized protein n=1 Tax=Canavalia gladiata TaxID=3824 RepID=A0AAN9Q661_CANGL
MSLFTYGLLPTILLFVQRLIFLNVFIHTLWETNKDPNNFHKHRLTCCKIRRIRALSAAFATKVRLSFSIVEDSDQEFSDLLSGFLFSESSQASRSCIHGFSLGVPLSFSSLRLL